MNVLKETSARISALEAVFGTGTGSGSGFGGAALATHGNDHGIVLAVERGTVLSAAAAASSAPQIARINVQSAAHDVKIAPEEASSRTASALQALDHGTGLV